MPISSLPAPIQTGRDLGESANDARLSKPLSDARLSAVVQAAYILREVSR
jgi:hypothetical protein